MRLHVSAVVAGVCLVLGTGDASRPFGYRSMAQVEPARTINGKAETTVFEYAIAGTKPADVAMLTYGWIETGNSALDRYVGDNLLLRYYVDGEPAPSMLFTPAMAAGSTVGLESATYYNTNGSDPARRPCRNRPRTGVAGPETCGLDLLDGWPWETKWFGKGGAASSWISHLRVPFKRSLRITVQVACGDCTSVPAEYRRPDIPTSATAQALTMFRGLEGAEDELGVDLGFGAMRLPAIGSRNLRLRSQRRTAINVTGGGMVELAALEQPGPGVAGAVLMLTVGFDGMRGPLDIEGCFWAVIDAGATLRPGANTSDGSSALLLGTGTEDLFGNAFGLSWTTRVYHNDNAGLSHVRGGPHPDNHGFPGITPGSSFFSAYRMFDKDPLPFEGQMQLYWRNGGRGKCSLPGVAGHAAAPVTPGPNQVHSLVFYYQWDAG